MDAFKSFKSTKSVAAINQEVAAWKSANTSTDMQALIDSAQANEMPNVAAAFVDPNGTV
jgi:hypothetical protein